MCTYMQISHKCVFLLARVLTCSSFTFVHKLFNSEFCNITQYLTNATPRSFYNSELSSTVAFPSSNAIHKNSSRRYGTRLITNNKLRSAPRRAARSHYISCSPPLSSFYFLLKLCTFFPFQVMYVSTNRLTLIVVEIILKVAKGNFRGNECLTNAPWNALQKLAIKNLHFSHRTMRFI